MRCLSSSGCSLGLVCRNTSLVLHTRSQVQHTSAAPGREPLLSLTFLTEQSPTGQSHASQCLCILAFQLLTSINFYSLWHFIYTQHYIMLLFISILLVVFPQTSFPYWRWLSCVVPPNNPPHFQVTLISSPSYPLSSVLHFVLLDPFSLSPCSACPPLSLPLPHIYISHVRENMGCLSFALCLNLK